MERIIRIKITVGIAHIMMIFRGYVLIQRQRTEQTLLITNINAAVGRVGRTSHAERRLEGFIKGAVRAVNM